MNSTSNSSSGQNGKAYVVVGDDTEVLTFVGSPETQFAPLDPAKRYNVFYDQASATDFLLYTTYDDLSKVIAGTAVYGSVVTQANVSPLAGFLGATPAGVTGIKITATRDGAADNGPAVIALGGRVRIRATPAPAIPDAGDVFPGSYAPVVAFA